MGLGELGLGEMGLGKMGQNRRHLIFHPILSQINGKWKWKHETMPKT